MRTPRRLQAFFLGESLWKLCASVVNILAQFSTAETLNATNIHKFFAD